MNKLVSKNNFRSDINGLRALAIIAVVIFHFKPAWLEGGFAGVDVFFVISGYLMTKIIFTRLDVHTFSLLDFYSARIKRIVPPLIVLCFFLLVFGWFFLIPSDYRMLGKHMATSLSFLSNIGYWLESGYFDAALQDKWLLHTWSLSVEWQFYIIYPLILVFLKKMLSHKNIKMTILIFSIAGFVFCIYSTHHWASSSFYLLPSRAWEMLIGGVAFLYPIKLEKQYKVIMQLVGITLILWTYLFVSETNLWPGYLSLVPVLGAYLVILSSYERNYVLNNFIFQKIGMYSYSIYLWHWPIVVGLIYFDCNSISSLYIGIILSLLLGMLSYYLIEQKLLQIFLSRFLFKKENKSSVIRIIMCALVVFTSGTAVFLYNGIGYRVDSNIVNADKASKNKPLHYQFCSETNSNTYCVFHSTTSFSREITNNVKAIVIGDSHAQSVVSSVVSVVENGDIIFYNVAGLPIMDLRKQQLTVNQTRNLRIKNITSLIHAHPDAKIIFINRLSAHFMGLNEVTEKNKHRVVQFKNEFTTLENNANSLKALYIDMIRGIALTHQVFILKPIPEHERHIPKTVAKALMLKRPVPVGISVEKYNNRNTFVINMLEQLDKTENITLIDPLPILCPDKHCINSANGELLYYDDDHLNSYGAEYIKTIFLPVFSH